jgi:ABC-type branched-subunit amino acid transport system substrate-binding protein
MNSRYAKYWKVAASALALMLVAGGHQALAQSGEGITPDTISIGTSTPLTAGGGVCKPIEDGTSAWFAHVNSQGGINGRKIDHIVLDDSYKAPEALANGRELVAKPVFAFFGGCGSLQPVTLLPIAVQNKMDYYFPLAGNNDLLTSKNAFNLIPAYTQQFGAITGYALEKHGPGSLMVVAGDMPGMTEAAEKMREMIEEAGGTFLGMERVTQQESDYTPLALKIKAARPDYIALNMIGSSSARFFKALEANEAFPAKMILGSQAHTTPAFLESAGSGVNGRFLIPLSNVPPSDERAKSCLDVLGDAAPAATSLTAWGCAIAQVLTAAIEETPEPLTREGIAKTLNGWKAKEASPLFPPITFSETQRLGLDHMFVLEIEDGKAVATDTVPIPTL